MKNRSHLVILYILVGFVWVLSACKSSPINTSPSPISTSTVSVGTLRADPEYMRGCKNINPNSVKLQASYKDIYPGSTTQDQVERILGKPLRVTKLKEVSWEYAELAVVFDGVVVDQLYVNGNSTIVLKDLVVQHGCPDVIYALDINEHPSGQYSQLLFVYPQLGLDFTIDKIPARLDDTVYAMKYFTPRTLEDYQNLFLTLNVPNASKPMIWEEAVN